MTDTIASLKRKVKRLEGKLEWAKAERDLYQMMAHDLASEGLIATILAHYPAIAKKWAVA